MTSAIAEFNGERVYVVSRRGRNYLFGSASWFVRSNLTIGGETLYNKKQMTVLSVCLVLAFTGFIGALSAPVTNTIIVTFDKTQAETAAITVLQEEIPNAIVVEFDGLQYNSLKMRAIGPMIYVGHGSDQGIQDGRSIVSAERMSYEMQSCPSSKIIILACDSAEIAAQDKLGRAYGFGSVVDAELAALEAVIRLNVFQLHIDSAFEALERYLNVAEKKVSGERMLLPLVTVLDPGDGGGTTPPPSPYFSSAELWNAIRIFAIGAIFALVGFGISCAIDKLGDSIARKICYYTVGATQTSKISAVFSFIKSAGIGAIGQAVTNVYGGYLNMAKAWLNIVVDTLDDWIDSLSVGEWAIFIGICALELVVIILTAGAEAETRLYVGIGLAAVTAGTIAIADALDSDSTPCQSLLQACGTFLD